MLSETFTLIRSLEERIIDPAIRRSPQALAELVSDDFLEFAGSGDVYRKDSVIAALTAESTHAWPEATNYGYEFRVLAEGLVLLTYRNRAQREGGAEVHSLRSSIWKLIDGRWQMVFHQGTPATVPAT